MLRAFIIIILTCWLFPANAQQSRKVVILAVDGLRPDALEAASTPNLDALISNGIYSPDALNDDITVTGPGWSAALCGVWSEDHLVDDNSFTPNDFTSFPSLIRRAEEHDPNLHTYSICSWAEINDFIVQDQADVVVTTGHDSLVAQQAPSYLLNNGPDLSVIYFDGIDFAGHDFGFSPHVSEYMETIELTDSYVGLILNAIESRPTYEDEDWVIIATTDHGGIGTEHGGSNIEEENVFMLVSGNSVEQKLISRSCGHVSDGSSNCLNEPHALSFSGGADVVHVPHSDAFDFGTDQDFTLECRVKTSIAADVAIIGTKDWESGYNPGFVFSFKYPDGPEWKVNISDGTERADIDLGGEIADGDWHTLSVSFDRDGLMTMYEDGSIVASEDISLIGDINNGQGLSLGADILGMYAYTGAIAEVRVWNSVIPANTIMDWSCDSISAVHPNYDDLIGYWRLNDGTGLWAMDHSAQENTAQIIGAEWTHSDSILICNYDSTPRLVDVFPTAFAHLCIAVNPDWELKGESLLPYCANTSVKESTELGTLEVRPNPTSSAIEVLLHPNSKGGKLSVYNSLGKLIKDLEVKNQSSVTLTLPKPLGVYLVEFSNEEGHKHWTKVIKKP